MRHQPQKMWLGRFYWQSVQRLPVVHALGCCLGLFVGFGVFNLFWDPQPNKRLDMLLKPLGVLILVGYGWHLIVFLLRWNRGNWRSHCESRILFFSGIDSSTGKQVASRPAKPIDFTANQILRASLVNLALATLLFIDVRLRWYDPFMAMLFSIGLLNPALSYIAIRRMTETEFSWRWLLALVLCLLGTCFWMLAMLTMYLRVSQSGQM